MINTMEDLFIDTLKDLYYAEKHILKALPEMEKTAHAGDLKKALENHRKETEGQIDRLESIFQKLDVTARGKKCEAIEGIIREAKDQMQHIKNATVLDACLIGSAQAIEHYEICRYGTLIEWAKELGMKDAAQLLEQTLQQEKGADMKLTKIANSSVNSQAAAC
jgi:ferritin-like metal-binding protein YciE